MDYKKTNSMKANATSFHGVTVECSYDSLVKIFGEPTAIGGDKTNAEWVLENSDGKILTIYDYKESFNPITSRGSFEWHIGTHSDGGYKDKKAVATSAEL